MASGITTTWSVLYRIDCRAVLFRAGSIKHRDEELELHDPERRRHGRVTDHGIACTSEPQPNRLRGNIGSGVSATPKRLHIGFARQPSSV